MKKFLFVALAASMMLVSFAGCKKNVEPKDMGAEVVKIMSGDDCAKVAKDLDAFIAANGEKWKTYMIDQAKAAVKDSKDIEEIMVKVMFNGDKSLAEKLEKAKCGEDPAVKASGEKLAGIFEALGEAVAKEMMGNAAADGAAK